MKQIYSKNEIFYHDYIKIKKYNDSCYKLIKFKHPVRQSGFEEIKDHEINLPEIERPTDYTNDEYLRQSLSRTKRSVHDYALCNEFEYFVTLTFDRKKYIQVTSKKSKDRSDNG